MGHLPELFVCADARFDAGLQLRLVLRDVVHPSMRQREIKERRTGEYSC